MRTAVPDKLEQGRICSGRLASNKTFGMCGAFKIQGPCGAELLIIVGDPFDPISQGWEHVSVSARRMPNWIEMAFVKDLCWNPEELVLQMHVPQTKHINIAETCLHLWRPTHIEIPLPPQLLV